MSGRNDRGPSKYSMSVSMYRGGRGSGRPRTAPPDLPSLLLDARICYLGMPVNHSLSLSLSLALLLCILDIGWNFPFFSCLCFQFD